MIKKLIIVSTAFVIVFLTIMLLVALHQINKRDLSTTPAATCNLKEKSPIYLVTYADGDAHIANQKMLAESALNNCVDVVYMYRKEHLDDAFVAKNKKILDQKRGAGYWLWKPYVVLKTLLEVPEGAVMIYLDSGVEIVRPLGSLINELDKRDMLFVENEPHLNRHWVKRDILKIMNMDNEIVRNSTQINAGAFVVRNTAYTREFMAKWLEIGEISGAIDDSKSKDEYSDFKEHRHDQSILSLLYLLYSNGINLISTNKVLDYVYWHRRRTMDYTLFIMDYVNKGSEALKYKVPKVRQINKLLRRLLKMERRMFPSDYL